MEQLLRSPALNVVGGGGGINWRRSCTNNVR